MEDIRLSGEGIVPLEAGVAPPPPADVAYRAGHALRSAAGRLRSSSMLDRENMQGLRYVPTTLDRVGEYLERKRLEGVKRDAERLIVARPLVALFAAILVGYAAGRAVRR